MKISNYPTLKRLTLLRLFFSKFEQIGRDLNCCLSYNDRVNSESCHSKMLKTKDGLIPFHFQLWSPCVQPWYFECTSGQQTGDMIHRLIQLPSSDIPTISRIFIICIQPYFFAPLIILLSPYTSQNNLNNAPSL